MYAGGSRRKVGRDREFGGGGGEGELKGCGYRRAVTSSAGYMSRYQK